jgi:hypothetical protein
MIIPDFVYAHLGLYLIQDSRLYFPLQTVYNFKFGCTPSAKFDNVNFKVRIISQRAGRLKRSQEFKKSSKKPLTNHFAS